MKLILNVILSKCVTKMFCHLEITTKNAMLVKMEEPYHILQDERWVIKVGDMLIRLNLCPERQIVLYISHLDTQIRVVAKSYLESAIQKNMTRTIKITFFITIRIALDFTTPLDKSTAIRK